MGARLSGARGQAAQPFTSQTDAIQSGARRQARQPLTSQTDALAAHLAQLEARPQEDGHLLDGGRALPPHLRLGITLAGLKEWLAAQPVDAVSRANESIDGRYERSAVFNGYVNQHVLTELGRESGGAYREVLARSGSAHVGPANRFVSWYLGAPIATLVGALEEYLAGLPDLRAESVFFWVCDFSVRQHDVDAYLAWLAECVKGVRHTLLLIEPWNKPTALTRAYCVKELYHTQDSNGQLELVMSDEQRRAFERTLVDDFETIASALSQVDLRDARCSKLRDQPRSSTSSGSSSASRSATRTSSG
jgi:hypothetical protein